MSLLFAILALVTLTAAAGALFLRNLVHCALSLALAFAGLACLYLQLGGQFVGLVQVLVYVGAVAILIIFAILLTQGGGRAGPEGRSGKRWPGALVASLVGVTLVVSMGTSQRLPRAAPADPGITVREVGTALMTDYVLPLEVVGLLLTAALIGAILLAAKGLQPK
jgi:NADH-quinone oxidoreductase subunit J